VWSGDETLFVSDVAVGVVWAVDTARGRIRPFGRTGGSPNGAVLATDGGLLVTQSGGIDFSHQLTAPPAVDLRPPALQRIDPDGSVIDVVTGAYLAPCDLAVAPNGTVYFTDPPHFQRSPGYAAAGRVFAWAPGSLPRVFAAGFDFCNGVAVDPAGRPVVKEGKGLVRLGPDGEKEWVVRDLGPGGGDGLCIDRDGRMYVAAPFGGGIQVVEDGQVVAFMEIDEPDIITTNCCFGGADHRTLFATNARPGVVVAWPDMPAPGLELTPWNPTVPA